MPYIKEARRNTFFSVDLVGLGELADEIQNTGEFNYVISYIANELVKRWGKTYFSMSAIRGAINDASDEFYRRVMVDYEDLKIAENGDVYNA